MPEPKSSVALCVLSTALRSELLHIQKSEKPIKPGKGHSPLTRFERAVPELSLWRSSPHTLGQSVGVTISFPLLSGSRPSFLGNTEEGAAWVYNFWTLTDLGESGLL